jgi:hypothetical protein
MIFYANKCLAVYILACISVLQHTLFDDKRKYILADYKEF